MRISIAIPQTSRQCRRTPPSKSLLPNYEPVPFNGGSLLRRASSPAIRLTEVSMSSSFANIFFSRNPISVSMAWSRPFNILSVCLRSRRSAILLNRRAFHCGSRGQSLSGCFLVPIFRISSTAYRRVGRSEDGLMCRLRQPIGVHTSETQSFHLYRGPADRLRRIAKAPLFVIFRHSGMRRFPRPGHWPLGCRQTLLVKPRVVLVAAAHGGRLLAWSRRLDKYRRVPARPISGRWSGVPPRGLRWPAGARQRCVAGQG